MELRQLDGIYGLGEPTIQAQPIVKKYDQTTIPLLSPQAQNVFNQLKMGEQIEAFQIRIHHITNNIKWISFSILV